MGIPGNFLSPTTEMVDPNTSGWAVKFNCAIALGSGGRNGDGCLKVTSVAAGEMQVRTVSQYAVVAGETYHAFADASGAVAERIGIRWLNTAAAEVSVTWGLTTTAASASWHRLSVGGAAPSGAAFAQVLLSSTAGAGGVISYYENAYLGLPKRPAGNLLDWNTESAEIDQFSWFAQTGVTVARVAPVISWAVDNYTAGGHVMAMTVTTAGTRAMNSGLVACTPGLEYLGYCYLNPPAAGSSSWVELTWYDASFARIGGSKSVLAAPATGWYRQRASGVAPAGAVMCAVTAGIDGATIGQVLRMEQAVIVRAPALQSDTVVPYADASFEQGIGGWTTTSGVAALARTSPWGAASWDASYALTVTSSTATASVIRSARFPLTGNSAGQVWRAQIYPHIGSGTWGLIGVRIRWYDAANTDVGVSAAAETTLPGADWYVIYKEATPPGTATQAAVEITVAATSAAAVLHVDGVSLAPVLPLAVVEAYSDAGYLALTLRELPIGQFLTVFRQLPDGSRVLVRGTSGLIDGQAITSDLMVIEDHEAPFGVPVRYQIEIRTASALTALRYSPYETLLLEDINTAWIKDPGNPQRNMLVMVQQAPEWQRPIEQAGYAVRGRRNRVVLSGVRQGLEGDLAIWTRSDDERRALHLLLDSGNTLLWQATPGMGVDDMYVSVGAITEARIGGPATELWRAWTLPLTEADMPVTTGVNGSGGRIWQDVLTEFATYADLLPVYATTEDLLLDRRTG